MRKNVHNKNEVLLKGVVLLKSKLGEKRVADLIIEQLSLWGVKAVYGVMGDAIFALTDALAKQDKIKFYTTKHESTAAFMASAQAKLTGELAVCIATSGPGLANLLNGLADASSDWAPVLVITGQVESYFVGTDRKQYIDQQVLISPLAVYSDELAYPDSIVKLLTKAMRTAISQRKVAHLSIPRDMLAAPVNLQPRKPDTFLTNVPLADPEVITEAVMELNKAQRPVMLVGKGALDSSAEIRQIAEKIGAGVINTLPAKRVLPYSHPLALGGIGSGGSETSSKILDQADTVFIVGTSWWPLDYTPKEKVKIIQLDMVPENIGKAHSVHLAIVGDAKKVLPEIARRLMDSSSPQWRQTIAETKEKWDSRIYAEVSQGGSPIPPQRSIYILQQVIPSNAIITLDVGDHLVWFNRVFQANRQRILISGKWRSMGFGLPAAMAAKITEPQSPVVAIVGDGGIGMVLADFLTAVYYKLPIVVVIFNNGCLAMEKNRLQFSDLHQLGTELYNPDFTAFAESCGGIGIRVTQSEELEPAFRQAFNAGQPVLLDIFTEDTVVPTTKTWAPVPTWSPGTPAGV